MKNRRGEIATLLTLGLILVGTVATIATSVFTNNQKNIASNPRASTVNCVSTTTRDCSIECGTSTCTRCTNGKYRCPGSTDDSITSSGSTARTAYYCPGSTTKQYWIEAGKYYKSAIGTTPYTSITAICGDSTTSCVGTATYHTCKSDNAAYTLGGYYPNNGKYFEDSKCKTQITIGPGKYCQNKNPAAAAPPAQPGASAGTGVNELCCKLYACNSAGTRQVTVVGFTGVKENGAVGYTSCATTGYSNVSNCSGIPGAPTTNGATGSVTYGCTGAVDPGAGGGGVDPGAGGGGQQGGGTGVTGPGGVEYCCLVYKQGLYASQYGCDASQFAAKVVGFTGVKDGTQGYTSCATTGYEKYSGTLKVGKCADMAETQSLAGAGTGSICIGDPDAAPIVEPEESAGPEEGDLGGKCKYTFSYTQFKMVYECNSPYVCSGNVCVENRPQQDTCSSTSLTCTRGTNTGKTYNFYKSNAAGCSSSEDPDKCYGNSSTSCKAMGWSEIESVKCGYTPANAPVIPGGGGSVPVGGNAGAVNCKDTAAYASRDCGFRNSAVRVCNKTSANYYFGKGSTGDLNYYDDSCSVLGSSKDQGNLSKALDQYCGCSDMPQGFPNTINPDSQVKALNGTFYQCKIVGQNFTSKTQASSLCTTCSSWMNSLRGHVNCAVTKQGSNDYNTYCCDLKL